MPGQKYDVTLDNSQFQRAAQGMLGSMLKIGTGIAAVAASAAGLASGFALVTKSLSAAAGWEQTEAQFKTLIGNVGLTKAVLKDLEKYGQQTSFEFGDIANSSKLLLAYGTQVTDLKRTMGVLGDLAATSGARLEDVALAYGKAVSKGTVFNETLDLFSERGIPVMAALAKQMGVNKEAISEMAAEGKIKLADLQRALGSLTNKGGQFFEGAKKQAETMNGLLSNLSDAWQKILKSIGTPINDALRPFLKQAVDYAATLAEKIAKVSEVIVQVVKDAQASGGMGALLKDSFEVAVGFLKNQLVRVGQGFGGVMAAMGANLVGYAIAFSDRLGIGAARFMDKMAWLASKEFWSGVGDLLVSAAKMFGSAVNAAFTPLLYGLDQIVDNLLVFAGKEPLNIDRIQEAAKLYKEGLAAAEEGGAKIARAMNPEGRKMPDLKVALPDLEKVFKDSFNAGPDAFKFAEATKRLEDRLINAQERTKKAANDAETQAKKHVAAADRQVSASERLKKAITALKDSIEGKDQARASGRTVTYDPTESATRRYARMSPGDRARAGTLGQFLFRGGFIDKDGNSTATARTSNADRINSAGQRAITRGRDDPKEGPAAKGTEKNTSRAASLLDDLLKQFGQLTRA